MRHTVALYVISSLAIAGACSSKSDSANKQPAKSPAADTKAGAAAKPAPPAAKPAPAPGTRGSAAVTAYSCNQDADCMNSCSQGAVTTRWYRASMPGGESCQDGCASKNMGTPRCVDNRCAAFDRAGKVVSDCTQIAGLLENPGPAHKCAADADCRASCRYGAVSKAWYALKPREECKDGCARKGTDAPKCEKGTCINYYQGKPDTICTQRAIW